MATTPLDAPKKVLDFYKNKSIAHSYNFGVTLNFDRYDNYVYQFYPELADNLSKYLELIKEHYVSSVDFPVNTFQRDTINVGTMQYSIPVLAQEQSLDIKITYVDDNRGTIAGFIGLLGTTIIQNGAHVPPFFTMLGDIHVSMYNEQGVIYGTYTAHDVFFLGGSGVNISYDSNDAISYDITFGTNYISYEDVGDDIKEIRNIPFTFGVQSFI